MTIYRSRMSTIPVEAVSLFVPEPTGTTLDRPASRALRIWAARQVVRQHRQLVDGLYQRVDHPRCPHCQPDGSCALLGRAEALLERERVPADA